MGSAADLPTGTVTFLFTDIEGSTRLARQLGEGYDRLLDDHRVVIRGAVSAHRGVEVACPGDGFVVAFASAGDAVQAAITAQRELTARDWPERAAIRVRMGVHSGTARVTTTGGTYVGLAVHEAARVMHAAHGGQVIVSDATAGLLAGSDQIDLLDLGLHHLRDVDRPRRLHQVRSDGLATSFPPLRDAEPAHRLPRPPTLVGRADDLAELKGALDRARLVTVVGPGGVGKTSLVLQAVHDRGSPGETSFVDLSTIPAAAGPEAVTDGIAAALGIDAGGDPRALAIALRGRDGVVIFDNCEHVIEAVAVVAGTVREQCPEATLLATSREPLGVPGEAVLDLPPLSGADAADLFRERAQGLGADVSSDPAGVDRVCEALDGLPLAIELAARRTRTLTPTAIADRLGDRFGLLSEGQRGRVDRQATLEATVAWSHELLDEAQRTLFRRLSVFVGGWTVGAAEAVCGFGSLAPMDVLGLLGALVDRSLVVARGDRFTMLETLRAYATERLVESGEGPEVADAHLSWCAALAERAVNDVFWAGDADEHRVLSSLAAEAANLRSAVLWALTGEGDAGEGLTTASTFGWLGQEFGAGHGEALSWIEALLPRVEDPLQQANGMIAAANASGPHTAGYAERGVALATGLEDGELLALIGRSLLAVNGTVRGRPVDLDAVRRELAEVRRRMRASGIGRIAVLAFEATAAFEAHDNELGLALAEEGVAQARVAGSSIGLSRCLEHVARGLARLGDAEGAWDSASEAVAVAQHANIVGEEALGRGRLARLAAARGDYDECVLQLDTAIALFERVGMWTALAVARAGAAATAVAIGDEELARFHVREMASALGFVNDTARAPELVAQPARAARRLGNEALAAELEAMARSA